MFSITEKATPSFVIVVEKCASALSLKTLHWSVFLTVAFDSYHHNIIKMGSPKSLILGRGGATVRQEAIL